MVNFEGFLSPAVNIEGSSPAAEESAFAEITKFTEFQSKTQSGTRYDVFINHHGKDVKKTLASLLYYNLCNKNLKVFLDNKTMQHGDLIPDKIRHAISTASVHIAIFSENYAKSAWCLSELCLMEESGAPIIPIFCGVQPSELRVKDKDEDTAYSKALHKLKQRFHRETIEKWTVTLQRVSYMFGFLFEGDQGILLENIAACVIKHIHTKRQSKIRRLLSGLCWEAQDMPRVLWLHDIATCTK